MSQTAKNGSLSVDKGIFYGKIPLINRNDEANRILRYKAREDGASSRPAGTNATSERTAMSGTACHRYRTNRDAVQSGRSGWYRGEAFAPDIRGRRHYFFVR